MGPPAREGGWCAASLRQRAVRYVKNTHKYAHTPATPHCAAAEGRRWSAGASSEAARAHPLDRPNDGNIPAFVVLLVVAFLWTCLRGVPAPTPQPAQIPWPASYYSSSFSCCKCCSSCDDYCYCYYSYLAPIQAKPRHANYLLYHFYFDVARPEPQCCSVPAIRLPIRRCISYTVIDTYLNS